MVEDKHKKILIMGAAVVALIAGMPQPQKEEKKPTLEETLGKPHRRT